MYAYQRACKMREIVRHILQVIFPSLTTQNSNSTSVYFIDRLIKINVTLGIYI